MVIPAYGAAQILNTPIIAVYRIGLYLFAFLFGYFILSHDEVVDVLKKWFPLFLAVSLVLIVAFCIINFGDNYADKPTNRTLLFVCDGYFTSLAVIGGFARYFDFDNGFTRWMSSRSFGLYAFHYMGISAVAVLIAKPGYLPPALTYLLTLIAGFGGGYLLNAIISRLPFFRWAVLGIKKKKEQEA
jgi:surface polysaccharide O-acyltransferase-like enzyme